MPFEIGIDKAVEVAVHNGPGIPDFVTSPVILDHGVRVEDIGANLSPPGNVFLLPFEGG